MPVINNKKNGTATIHAVANATFVIAGNNSVSNIALPGEQITGASIAQMWFGSPSGAGAYWEILRGANTVGSFDSTAYLDFRGNGELLSMDPTANVVVQLSGATKGFMIITLIKHFAANTAASTY